MDTNVGCISLGGPALIVGSTGCFTTTRVLFTTNRDGFGTDSNGSCGLLAIEGVRVGILGAFNVGVLTVTDGL